VNRETQGFVLLLLGGAVLRAGLTDVYLRYVKAGLRPLLLLAGVVLIIAALATFWYELRRSRAHRRDEHDVAGHDVAGHDVAGHDVAGHDVAGHDVAGHDRAGHDGPGQDNSDGHAHREPRIAWLLVLPVFVLILVVPPALGSYAAGRTGTALQPGLIVATATAGDPAPMSLLNYATLAVYEHGGPLGNRRVKITGFITIGPHGAPYLTRMILTCCAADAQPIKVGLSGQVPPALKPDVWLEITGTYTDKQITDDVNGGPIPFIQVSQTTPVPAPHDPYGA
jgi:uncharacterized repeat protein (TIGR03943 family)